MTAPELLAAIHRTVGQLELRRRALVKELASIDRDLATAEADVDAMARLIAPPTPESIPSAPGEPAPLPPEGA